MKHAVVIEHRPTSDGACMTKALNEPGGRGCQGWIKMDQTSEVFKTSEV